jgi:pyrimidine operon attenuation protein/uracil phosphoribosyltransferase
LTNIRPYANFQFLFHFFKISMKKNKTKVVLSGQGMAEALDQMVARILADYSDTGALVLIGIRTGGAFLANRIREKINQAKTQNVPLGLLDITLYRDDWTRINHKPIIGKTDLPFSLDDKIVILVDDVLYTGRTVRAALDAMIDFGRPRRIALAVLVDRSGRELPICADYIGIQINTRPGERVNVAFKELGQIDQVVIEEGSGV